MAELNGRPVHPDALAALALTNYGHFTSMRCDNGRIRGLQLHMERLVRDCREVFGAELDVDRVREYVRQGAQNRQGSFVIRVTIFDPDLQMGHPGAEAHPQILVTVRSAGEFPAPPMTVRTQTFTRDTAQVKHMGLFPQLKARREAQLAGSDDALFADADGVISEGGTWNVGFVDQDGAVIWPEGPVLPGVTMKLLQNAHPYRTQQVTLNDLSQMRAAFATNTSIGVRPITAIDDRTFPADDPTLDKLRSLYADIAGDEL
ncbi:aminotransferase class IV family protein [Streptomyces sp. B-S-A8]|uniref:Aminotransferase class IV family protein n=1 Tax=Streptomyces solicavernae TaxID=3043614 RepID=A0ABT6S0D2_9ACTN|nr:aminotransferase class IV family protein [Streptomyces sp. B-S-A8]MDI3390147.1 aminotransferase class IV family protein [Streptomyces sp. B-S-A8]